MTTNATDTPPLTEGQRLAGCFTLKRSLSALEEGAVWLGQDEVLGKEVTLHFVPPGILRDQRAVAELRQEVKRNRQLIHPNILRVYDYVEDSGIAAISMDKYDGQSIAELLRSREALEAAEIQPWISQLAETLSDAHRIQLIHRDLAPDNVILKSSGGILLSNFGISRSMHDALERAGLARGARTHLSYMSPQQIDGDRPVPADDVYGLGALIFELLAGRPPFVGDDLVPLIRKATVPSINNIRAEIGKGSVPASWQAAVEACLAKMPEQRPRSCGEVAALIASGKAVSSTSSSAPTPSRMEPRESTAPSRSASVEPPTKNAVDSTPSKDSPATSSSVKSNLPPTPPPSAPAKKEKPAPALSANYPDLDRPKSKTPVVLVGVAALVLGAGVLLRNLPEENQHTDATGSVENVNPPAAPATPTNSASNGADGGGKSQEPPAVASAAGTPAPSSSPLLAAVAPSDDQKEAIPEPPSASAPSAPAASTQPSVPQPTVQPAVEPEPVVVKSTEAPAPVSSQETAKAEESNTPTSPQTGTEGLLAANKPKSTPLIGAEPSKTPAASEAPKSTPVEAKPVEKTEPAATETAKPANGTPAPALPTLPPALPKLSIPANASLQQLEEILAERQAAADKLAETAKAADAVAKENLRIKEAKQAEVDQFKKTYDDKRKGFAQVIQTGASVESDTAKMKDSMEKAKAAALEAVKAAEAAERNYNEFISKSGEKLAAKTKAEGELRDLVFKAGDQSKGVDELSTHVTKAESLRQQIALSQRQLEQDKTAINAQLTKARAAEMEALRKANREKIAGVEAQIKPLEAEATKYKNALGQLKDLGVAGAEASKPIQQQLDAVNAKISTLQDEIKALNAPPVPGKHAKPSASAPVTPPAAKVTETPVKAALSVGGQPVAPSPAPSSAPATPSTPKVTPPAPAPVATAGSPAAMPGENAAAPASVTNSLGMKFLPVGNVQFAVYPTTREQFEVFAKATNLKNNAWQNPWFQQGPDHPVVNVTWREADAFCKWLSEKERKNGLLKSGEAYRLPSDNEWSKAVGLTDEKGATPEERDMGVQNVYPWGSQWPPPAGAGNYAGEETKGENPIQGYNDGFENTSPVGKFKPTSTGLYDMSGNIWQWVSDDWNGEKRNKTLRGGSWYNGAIQLSLLSSCRIGSSPDNQNDTYGFRVVKAAGGKR